MIIRALLKNVLIGLIMGVLLTSNLGEALSAPLSAGNDDNQPIQEDGQSDSSQVSSQNEKSVNPDDIFVSAKNNLSKEEIASLSYRQSDDPNLTQMKAGDPRDTYRLVSLILVMGTVVIIMAMLMKT